MRKKFLFVLPTTLALASVIEAAGTVKPVQSVDPCGLGGWAALQPEALKQARQLELPSNPFRALSYRTELVVPDLFT